jgi:hypothetical protein
VRNKAQRFASLHFSVNPFSGKPIAQPKLRRVPFSPLIRQVFAVW